MKYKLLIIAIAVTFKTNAQITASFGAGAELNKGAKLAQIRAGVSIGRNEITIGAMAFLPRSDDAKFPWVINVRYGLNLLNNEERHNIQLLPLIGLGMTTEVRYEKEGETEITIESKKYKLPLYGIKVQKLLKESRKGWYASLEHCKYTYIVGGMFIKIN